MPHLEGAVPEKGSAPENRHLWGSPALFKSRGL
jgi:hypothetical protein